MTRVFADTSYYVALLNERDSLHERAVVIGESLTAGIITTEFVLVEVANFFRRPGQRDTILPFFTDLRLDGETTLLSASSELFRAGLALFAARPDKEWSLTDCTSFVVMTERNMTDALTADNHFVQAGFRALLLEELN
jgi:predicted nucleic acid-binding protein